MMIMKNKLIENQCVELTENFTMKEFFSARFTSNRSFCMPMCLIEGCQVIRDYFNVPFTITCTYAPWQNFGFHRLGWAVDLVPSSGSSVEITKFMLECYKYQYTGASNLIKQLREAGVQGFGLENNNCIHIDWRNGHNIASLDRFGHYIVFEWVNDGSKYGKSRVISRSVL